MAFVWNSEAYRLRTQRYHARFQTFRLHQTTTDLAREATLAHSYWNSITRDEENNLGGSYRRLTSAGNRMVEGLTALETDFAARHRLLRLRHRTNPSTTVFVLNQSESDYDGILGISFNQNNNIITTYISDVVRYIHPEHTNGSTLKRVLQRACSKEGFFEDRPLFPSPYNLSMIPFDSALNDGSAIAVSFRLNTEVHDDGGTEYTLEPLGVDFATLDNVEFITPDQINTILRSVNNFTNNNAGDNSPMSVSVQDAENFARLSDLFNHYTFSRQHDVPDDYRRMLCFPVMSNRAEVHLATEYITHEDARTQNFPYAIHPPPRTDFSDFRALGLFREFANATNHAIGLYCEQHGLPIVYRGAVRDFEGGVFISLDDDEMCGVEPYGNAAAGMAAFAPTVEGRHSALAYLNQYLLHKHLDIRTVRGRGNARTITYNTNMAIDYSAFNENVHPGGYLNFAKLVHPRALWVLDARDWIKRQIIRLELRKMVRLGASYPVPTEISVELSFMVTRHPPPENIENGRATFDGLVHIHNLGLTVDRVSFRGEEDRVWILDEECHRNVRLNALLTNIDIRGSYVFHLDANSQPHPILRYPESCLLYGDNFLS